MNQFNNLFEKPTSTTVSDIFKMMSTDYPKIALDRQLTHIQFDKIQINFCTENECISEDVEIEAPLIPSDLSILETKYYGNASPNFGKNLAAIGIEQWRKATS